MSRAGRAAVLPALLLALVSACSAGAPPANNGAAGSSQGGSPADNAGGGAASQEVAGGGTTASGGDIGLSGGAGNTSIAGSAGSGGAGGSLASGGAGAGGSGGEAAGKGGTAGTGSDSVLYIGGDSPMVGVDLQLHQVLQGMKLQVEDARETAAPARATGKRLIVFSYSMSSTSFKAEDWASVPVPIIVLEHYLLPRLGMTKTDGHGYRDSVTALELTSDDPVFSAGVPKGKVTVYSKVNEFFWGVPAPSALTIATAIGAPTQAVTFGYTAGSMMVGMVAPARRVQVFVAVHAPPANSTQFLSADGLKLFGGAAAWAIN